MADLNCCPFCGGKAKLEDMGFPHHVFCTECGARVTGQGFAEDGEKDAILKWNRRIETVRCKDCEHRPVKDDDEWLTFPDYVCPCQNPDDSYYSWYPSDDWFCGWGKRKEVGGE